MTIFQWLSTFQDKLEAELQEQVDAGVPGVVWLGVAVGALLELAFLSSNALLCLCVMFGCICALVGSSTVRFQARSDRSQRYSHSKAKRRHGFQWHLEWQCAICSGCCKPHWKREPRRSSQTSTAHQHHVELEDY
jgi:hypothetical protein